MIVEYKGAGKGPKLNSKLLSKGYDFRGGSCTMTDEDAAILIQRNPRFFKKAEDQDQPTVEVETKKKSARRRTKKKV